MIPGNPTAIPAAMHAGMQAPSSQSPIWPETPPEPDNLQLILEKAHDISFGSVVTVEPVSDVSSCSRSSLSMDHGSAFSVDSLAYVCAPTATSPALFHRLPADVIYHILVASDPPSFTSLSLLNRRWRRQSNISALYYLQLLKLFPVSARQGSGQTLDFDSFSNLSVLKRTLARHSRRGLWPSCLPLVRLLDLKMFSAHLDLSVNDLALTCASAHSGRIAVLYSISHAFVLDFHRGTPSVKHQIAVEDAIQTVALSRDGKSIALATCDGALRLDRLDSDGLYTVLNMRLYGVATTVAVASHASVIAVAYKQRIEITAFHGSIRTKRILACAFVEHLEFSENGKLLLATTTSGSCTTVAKLDTSADPHSDTGSLEAAWSYQPISLKAFQNCTHAVFLPSKDSGGQELIFGLEKTVNAFGIFNVASLTFERTTNRDRFPMAIVEATQWSLPTVSHDGLEIAVASSNSHVLLFRRTSEIPLFNSDPTWRSLQQRSQNHGDNFTSYELVRRIELQQSCSAVKWVRSSKRESLACFRSVLSYFEPNTEAVDPGNRNIALVDFGIFAASRRPRQTTIALNAEAPQILLHRVEPVEPELGVESLSSTQPISCATPLGQVSGTGRILPVLDSTSHGALESLQTIDHPSNIEFEFGATSEEQEAAVSKALDSIYQLDDFPLPQPAFLPEETDQVLIDMADGPLLRPVRRSSTWQRLNWRSKKATATSEIPSINSYPSSDLPLDKKVVLPSNDPYSASSRTRDPTGSDPTQNFPLYEATLPHQLISPSSVRKAKRQSWHSLTTRSNYGDEMSYLDHSPADEAALSPTISQTEDRTRKAARRHSGYAFLTTPKSPMDKSEFKPISAHAQLTSAPLTHEFPKNNTDLTEEQVLKGFTISIPSLDQQASLRRRHLSSTQNRISLTSRPIGNAPRAARGAYQPSYSDLSLYGLDSHCNSMASQRSGYSMVVGGNTRQTDTTIAPTSDKVPASSSSSAAPMPASIPEEGEEEFSNNHVENETSVPTDLSANLGTVARDPNGIQTNNAAIVKAASEQVSPITTSAAFDVHAVDIPSEDAEPISPVASNHAEHLPLGSDNTAVDIATSAQVEIPQGQEMGTQRPAPSHDRKIGRRKSSMLRLLKFDGLRGGGKTMIKT